MSDQLVVNGMINLQKNVVTGTMVAGAASLTTHGVTSSGRASGQQSSASNSGAVPRIISGRTGGKAGRFGVCQLVKY